MTRKALSVVIAAVIAFSLLPAVSAFASATGTAKITDGGEVLPAAATPFSMQVQAADRPVNYIQFVFPQDRAGITANPLNPITPPDGWQAGYKVAGAVHTVVFFGGSILPGGTLDVTFPGDVARPATQDLTGTWKVYLSSNGGATLSQASPPPRASLSTTVRILDTETVTLVSPSGVLDKTGTEFQTIQMQTTVKNYALSSVEVTPTLSASAGFFWRNDEQITSDAPRVVASGGTAAFAHTVILGSAKDSSGGTGDKTTTFTADATAPNSNGYRNEQLGDFVVQVKPNLSLPSVNDVAPRTVKPSVAVTVNMPLRKSRNPALTINSGSMSFSKTTCPIAAAGTFASGNNQDATLSFNCNVEAFKGEESFPTNVTLTGIDDNGAPWTRTYEPMQDNSTPARTLQMTIDSLIPVVTLELQLPRDEDGNQQTAVKKGDTVRISGTIEDGDAWLRFLELRSNTGEAAVRTEITEIPDLTFDGTRFIADVTVPFEAPAGQVHAFGVAVDPAGWVGRGASLTKPLDNVKPLLNYGETVSTTDVQSIVFDGEDYEETLIKVSFEEQSEARSRGGCNPTQWKVDGAQVVVAVLYPNGDGTSWVQCEKDQPAPDGSNQRLLLLGVPIDRNATPSVTYTPIAGDRVHDGAGNTAVQRVIDTVAGIAPPLPSLIQVYRNTGTIATGEQCKDKCEVAYSDEGKRWTRFSGNDLLVHVERGAPGYTLQVLDAAGLVIASKAVSTTSPSIRVPIGTTDGDYARGLRFVNARGITSDNVLELTVALDTVVPQLASPVEVTEAGTKDQVKVPFSEKVVEGLDVASNWPLFDEYAPGQYDTYFAEDVRQDPKPPFSTEKGYRVLTANTEQSGDAEFAGVGYVFDPFTTNNVRYGDRAGNKLADIGQPAAKPAPSADNLLS